MRNESPNAESSVIAGKFSNEGELRFMTRLSFVGAMRIALCTALLAILHGYPAQAQISTSTLSKETPDAYFWNNRPPDPRFKADILVVVAHPDDEDMVVAYLAREIYDHDKRVAVVYENTSPSGNDRESTEQAAALGDAREIEARTAVGSLGISNVWFLGGSNISTQNPLDSLEEGGNGRMLDQLVRIVRLTRPSVILTWLPDSTTGENHGDHQASGILATEAFDLAGNPTVFPEQVSPALHPNVAGNMTEALHPWQPEKIYYFYNPTYDIFKGQGPQYSSEDISPSQHVSYGLLGAKDASKHWTQGKTRQLAAELAVAIANHNVALSGGEGEWLMHPVKFIFGKSLVPSGVTDDVFTGVVPEGIPYQRPPGYVAVKYSEPTLLIGDPWAFYKNFWQAHGIDHLATLVLAEISVHTDGVLYIPLIIENPLDRAIDVSLSVQAPDGWKLRPLLTPLSVPAHAEYFADVEADAPSASCPAGKTLRSPARQGIRAWARFRFAWS